MAFSVLMMFQMFNVLNVRSEKYSLFKVGILTNKKLIIAILISIGLQVLAIHTPLRTLFKTVPLTGIDWVYVFAVSASLLVIVEIIKFVKGIFVKD